MENIKDQRKKFLKENKIHESYHEFFSCKNIKRINNIMDVIGKERYLPEKNNIFKAFEQNIEKTKVVLLGMDPYPQEGIATGLAFEVEKESWLDKEVNTSLKNMTKLIYKTYNKEIVSLEKLREEITNNNFNILPPNKIFKSWVDQGVLLLNSALTVENKKPGSHIKLWKDFTGELLTYLEVKNSNLIFLLWGAKAISYKKYLKKSKIIEHNHPAICGNLKNPKDFMNGNSFEETKDIINWLG